VRFEDGHEAVTSRNALAKVKTGGDRHAV